MKIYFDRYGYASLFGDPGESDDSLLRRGSNLSDDADLKYAVGTVDTVPDNFDVNAYNEVIASKHR